MSGKSTGLVWDMRLGRGPLKTVLLAYADHADHEGKNMHPSIGLIVWKTELSESTVHRCVNELIELGLLIPDGVGAHGTKNYRLGSQPDRVSLRQGVNLAVEGGVKNDAPLGDLGMPVTPELNGRTEEEINKDKDNLLLAFEAISADMPNLKRQKIRKIIAGLRIRVEAHDGFVNVFASGLGIEDAEIMQDRYGALLARALRGVYDVELAYLTFEVPE
jgi:hypothetical protein